MKWLICSLVLFSLGPLCILSNVQLAQPGSKGIKPGESLRLTCIVCFTDATESINDYYWNWIRQPPGKGLEWMGDIDPEDDRTRYSPAFQSRINISPDSSTNEIHLHLSSTTTADTATYYCTMGQRSFHTDTNPINYYYYGSQDENGVYPNYPFDFWGPGASVTVTSATATAPDVFPLSPCCQDLSSASQVTMGCLVSNYFPLPATVKWNSGSISSGIKDFPAIMQSSSSLYRSTSQLTVPASSWQSKTFQCNVAHTATSTTINKDIRACSHSKPSAPEVQLLHSSCSSRTDDFTIQLVCLISGFYPKTLAVNWLVGGKSGRLAAFTESPWKAATGNTFSTTSTANVTQLAWKEGKTYTCQVVHEGTTVEAHASKCRGDSSGSCDSNVKISVTPPTPADLYMNGDPKLTCLVTGLESDVGLKVSWSSEKLGILNPEPLEASSDSDGTFSAKSSLIVSKQNWLTGDIYTCKAEHPSFVSPLTKAITKKTGKRTRPHVYLFRPHNEELKSRDPNLSITCLVKGFNPAEISIKWLENHSVMAEDNHVTTAVQLDSRGDSYFVVSKLDITKAEWNDGNSYTCHVVHEGFEMKYTQRTVERIQGKK